jgi:hypothetical protein
MRNREVILKELIDKWEALSMADAPPKEPMKLLTEEECVVYVENGWGPAVPYPPVERGDGHMNHGYRRVKGDSDAIASIPEAADSLEYQAFLQAINSTDSPIESVGCEKALFPVHDHPTIKVSLGSYTDILFSDLKSNCDPKNILYLASVFVAALSGSAAWWSKAEMGIERLRALYGYPKPWGLMLRVTGYGRTEEEARMTWAMSLTKLSQSVMDIKLIRSDDLQ